MSVEINQADQNTTTTAPKTQKLCIGCDRLCLRCDINEPSVQEYYARRGFCFDSTVEGIPGTKTIEGFKPD